MTTRRLSIESELRVLQEAVASAVHELSQPLNVVNLLADNALDDVATLQAAGAADAAVLGGLRRRVEAIVEHAGKASDITRWVRAFAVGIGEEATAFDPGAVIDRVAGIFGSDLRVAGVDLSVDTSAAGGELVVGNEALFGFALTEAILWMAREPGQPAAVDTMTEAPLRQVAVCCMKDPSSAAVAVTIGCEPPAPASDQVEDEEGRRGLASEPDEAVAAALPLLARAGQSAGASLVMTRKDRSVRITLSLPLS